MQLSKDNIKDIQPHVRLKLPAADSYQFPEKILQFGTGVLLRGLPDYFIDMANRQQIFNGRIVMIKSTDHGNIDTLKTQDNLYTLCIRGQEDGQVVEEYYLNNSISRILHASSEWKKILQCASDENIQIIISNTTEVGIQLTDDDINADPPASYPGKLLALLHARYKAFNGDESKGMVIIPTELIIDNGDKLKEILINLSQINKLSDNFIQWLKQANTFSNSLVDRIVPGKPGAEEKRKIEKQLGYEDAYLIEAEPYRLWAIEIPDDNIKSILSFSLADKGVVLTKDISKYRELKLRLLNGTHTFSCAFAFLNGFDTVRSAMEDRKMNSYIRDLMQEIIAVIVDENITRLEADAFAGEVVERFSNPYIVHHWLSISVQYSFKMKTRNVPLLVDYYKKFNNVPQAMAKGLAAYIRFMHTEKKDNGTFEGHFQGKKYVINDDRADTLFNWWKQYPQNPVKAILRDKSLWGTDLTLLDGLTEAVAHELQFIPSPDFA